MAVTRVSTDGLADSAVNSAKIGVDVITDADLANNSVTVNEIADLAVTHSKLHNTMDLSGKTVTLPSLANLNTTGSVGVGTTSPRMKLTVEGSNATSIGLGIDNSDGSGTLDLVALGSSYSAHGASAGEVWFYSPDNINIGGATGNSNVIKFLGGGSERMRLDNSGNLGIGITNPTVPVHVAPDGTYSKTTPFTLSGGKLYSNDIYTDYVYKWSGNATRTVDLLCNSYHMAEVTYTSHQTNGGSDIHRHIKGKWANNHTTHTWTPYTNTGDTWSIGLSISATDQSGSSSGSANGRLRVRQTYGSGSYAYSTLTIRTYYDAFTGINISTS